MRKAAILVVIFLLMLLAPLAVRYLQFYRPFSASRAAPPVYTGEGIPAVPTPATSAFVDEPVAHRGDGDGTDGIVVLDQAHDNQFDLAEIAHFDSLLAGRGYQLAPFAEGELADALRPADALIVIAPLGGYSPAEVLAVREFTARGGRVLLVGDPTRYNVAFDEADIFAPPIVRSAQVPLNDLANAFDITFRGDYLYNTEENEGNFRNILLGEDGFAPSELTDGLERLAFYSSHSLELGPSAAALLSGDDDTWSSATDRPGGLTLAALSPAGDEAAVLALGDFHFLIDPYNAVYDNGEFAARVADFLTANGDGPAALAAFPYFLRAPVDLTYSGDPELGPDAFDDIIALQAALRGVGLPLALAADPAADRDTLTLGLYNQAGDVADALERAGIELTIRPAISPPAGDEADEEPANGQSDAPATGVRVIESSLGTVQMSGSALILLDTTDERRQVIVLAASNDGLERALARLQPTAPAAGADFSDCLLQANVAICPTGVENEPVEYELVTSGPGEASDEPAAESDEEPAPRPDEEPSAPAEAADQGAIALGETKSAELAAEEAHAWTFSDGPATIDIVVDGAEDMDSVVELYDPNNDLMGNMDSTFAGDVEEMRGIEIPDEGDYTIRVRDFFNDGGSYELSVTAGEPGDDDGAGAPGNRVFIFADDDGEPLGDGLTSADAFAEGLASGYDVTVWTSSTDGPLPADTLADYDLVIWDSGTYRDEDGLFSQDSGRIIEYLDAGGDLLINGSSPTILGPVELAPLANVAIVADNPVLSDGFNDGDLLELDDTYEAAISDNTNTAANEVIFLARAPEEEGAGAVVALAADAINPGDPQSIILFAPFVALPAEARAQLLANMMAWFGMA